MEVLVHKNHLKKKLPTPLLGLFHNLEADPGETTDTEECRGIAVLPADGTVVSGPEGRGSVVQRNLQAVIGASRLGRRNRM